MSVFLFKLAIMSLKLFKSKPGFKINLLRKPSLAPATNPQPRPSFKINAKLWRTILSIAFFILGIASVGWGGLNLLDQAQVPECVYLVDEQRPQVCLSAEINQASLETDSETATETATETDSSTTTETDSSTTTETANLAYTCNANSSSATEFQPLPEGLGQITVQILGAVESPGVYQLNFFHRLGDLFKLAGGLTEDADQQYIIRNFNLAQRLTDEQRVYIPFKQEQELSNLLAEYCRLGGQVSAGSIQVGSSTSGSSSQTGSATSLDANGQTTQTGVSGGAGGESRTQGNLVAPSTQPLQVSQEDQDYLLSQQEGSGGLNTTGAQSGSQGGCISINNASSEQLQTLTGVGPATATKIIEGRPYSSINDLLKVSGIGNATLEKIEPYVCL